MIAKIEIEIDYEIDGLLPNNLELDKIFFEHLANNSGVITSEGIDNHSNYTIIINSLILKTLKKGKPHSLKNKSGVNS